MRYEKGIFRTASVASFTVIRIPSPITRDKPTFSPAIVHTTLKLSVYAPVSSSSVHASSLGFVIFDESLEMFESSTPSFFLLKGTIRPRRFLQSIVQYHTVGHFRRTFPYLASCNFIEVKLLCSVINRSAMAANNNDNNNVELEF